MSNKVTNVILSLSSSLIGDKLGTSPCNTCTSGDCCAFQHTIGIGKNEFDEIEHLVTPTHIARAKVAVEANEQYNGKTVHRCPFLSDDNKCEIYDDRFIVCAGYSVVGTSEQCSVSNCDGDVAIVNPMGVFDTAMSASPKVKPRLVKASESTPTDVISEFVSRYLKDK